MAKLSGLFTTFLSNIEPDPTAKDYAQKAHERVRGFLERDPQFNKQVLSTYLYGSYKRQTAVGDIKDVDIIVLTKFDQSITPDNALKTLKEALVRCYKDASNPEYQTRSIKVNDPLPGVATSLTLDVIPAIPLGNEEGPILVPDRNLKTWVKSHPKGHLANTSRLNDEYYSKQKYIPLVKVIRWWWKHQAKTKQPNNKKPKPKGFWLECLVSQHFDPSNKYLADHFVSTLRSIVTRYSLNSGVPQLPDPGLPDQTIRAGMTQEEFNLFLQTANESLQVAKSALQEENEYESSRIWQSLFGKEFPFSAREDEYSVVPRDSLSVIQLQDFSHKQELSDIGIQSIHNPVKLNITAGLYFGTNSSKIVNRRYQGNITSSSELPPHHWIKYTVSADVPDIYDYSIYWQVINTGAHAQKEGCLRGQIFKGGIEQWEQSLYTGKHWIECFLVDKYNNCVGRSDPFYVIFRNPAFPYHILR